MANAYRYIGKATPRKDATEIVTGGAKNFNIHKNLLQQVVISTLTKWV